MPRKSETNLELDQYFVDSFELPNDKLRSHFGKVVKGNPDVYDTPFAKGESTKNLLGTWKKTLVSISDRWPSLWKFENDLAAKVGPMSVMAPLEERLPDIDHYYDDILLSSTPIHENAIREVVREWNQGRGLRVRSQSDTLKKMKKSSNSGSPFYEKRREVIDRTMPVFVQAWSPEEGVYQALDNGYSTWMASAVLGWRGQEGGYSKEDVKQRVIWMFPFAVNVAELQVYQPLIETAQKFDIVPAWVSMDKVDEHITALFDTKMRDDLIVCTDFTKFDQHFNGTMQECAKTILKRILTPNYDTNSWFENVYDIKYMIPLAYDFGLVRFGRHGMASGSGGTNADETLAHRALQHEAAISKGVRLNPHSMCLGDDGVLSYPGITADEVTDVYSSHGLDMNPEKQSESAQDCVYLRRWHHNNYRINGICAGVYSTCRALGRLRYLERFMDPEVWDEKAVCLRELSIIENCKYHPLREEFVQYCMKRDKFRLGVDIPGFLDDIRAVAQEKVNLMPDFLGYTKTLQSQGDELGGIENWWIVNYLKSM